MESKDWHKADIVAAVKKRGTSLAALSRAAGLASSTLSNTLRRPWPKGEKVIANCIDVHPAEIWPSRYKKKPFDRKKPALPNPSK